MKKKSAERPSAYAASLRLLTVRDRSERELRQRLQRKLYSREEITAAVEKLRALGYLDDARFAQRRAESLIGRGRLGPRAVAARLAAAGVERGSVKNAVDDAMSERDELQLARAALQKRHPDALSSNDSKLRAKAARFLLGRGFSGEVANRLLRTEGSEE